MSLFQIDTDGACVMWRGRSLLKEAAATEIAPAPLSLTLDLSISSSIWSAELRHLAGA